MRQFLLLAAVLATASGMGIDAMKHSIQKITAQNFDAVIGKFRNDAVSLLWHFNPSDDKAFLDTYDKIAQDLKGMVKVTAIDCEENAAFCKKHDVIATPHITVFPPNPVPHYKYGGDLSAADAGKKLSNHALNKIPSFVTELKDKAGMETFITSEPSKPKVLLFTDKTKVPSLFKALSSEQVLHRTTKFAFVNKEAADIVNKFKPKSYPSIMMHRRGTAGKMENEFYKGEMKFMDIHAWVNLYSESGMGDTLSGAAAARGEPVEDAKPWRAQDVPEVSGPSHKDVCFKNEGLCVMYLKDKGPLDASEEAMLKGMHEKYTSNLSGRGTVLKWMWMDLSVEKEFAKLFDMEHLPGVVVFNPHKRLRFTKPELEGTVTEKDIDAFLEKILGGDARFKIVKGQKLPPFATRKVEGKEAKSEL